MPSIYSGVLKPSLTSLSRRADAPEYLLHALFRVYRITTVSQKVDYISPWKKKLKRFVYHNTSKDPFFGLYFSTLKKSIFTYKYCYKQHWKTKSSYIVHFSSFKQNFRTWKKTILSAWNLHLAAEGLWVKCRISPLPSVKSYW